jgi:hypothetical protein
MKLINCKDIEKKLPLSNFDDFVDENYENNNIIYISFFDFIFVKFFFCLSGLLAYLFLSSQSLGGSPSGIGAPVPATSETSVAY